MKLFYCSILLSLCLVASCSAENVSNVTISNKSGTDVSFLDVDLGGKTQHISKLASGAVSKIEFHGLGDSHYKLVGKLSDGTQIDGEFGYVTSGMNFDDTFVISKDGKVEFDSQSY